MSALDSAILALTPKGYWKLQANADDSSGNGYDLSAVSGGVTFDGPPLLGGALASAKFNGTGYLRRALDSGFNGVDGTDSGSFSFLVKMPSTWSGSGMVFEHGQQQSVFLPVSASIPGNLRYNSQASNPWNEQSNTTGAPFAASTIYHVVVVGKWSDHHRYIYVNGALAAVDTNYDYDYGPHYATAPLTGLYFVVGNRSDAVFPLVANTCISNLAWYTTALTAPQVAALYAAVAAGGAGGAGGMIASLLS